jgi:hypothetical protein
MGLLARPNCESDDQHGREKDELRENLKAGSGRHACAIRRGQRDNVQGDPNKDPGVLSFHAGFLSGNRFRAFGTVG